MMRVPPSSSGWVVSAAGGIVQRGQCTTNVVHIVEIDLVYYSSDTEHASSDTERAQGSAPDAREADRAGRRVLRPTRVRAARKVDPIVTEDAGLFGSVRRIFS